MGKTWHEAIFPERDTYRVFKKLMGSEMQSKLVFAKRYPSIELLKISEADRSRIARAIESFREATPHNNKTFCDEVAMDVRAGKLRNDLFERLSVWCHTDQPPRGVSSAAQDLARELLGHVPPRLRGTGKARVKNYDSLVKSFAALLSEVT